jgi:hypothetical protein
MGIFGEIIFIWFAWLVFCGIGYLYSWCSWKRHVDTQRKEISKLAEDNKKYLDRFAELRSKY